MSNGLDTLTGDMARIISQRYLSAMQRTSRGIDSTVTPNMTERDCQRILDEATITNELCLELMDSLILSRFDYIVQNAIEKSKNKEEM